jgi:hypothetical protein
MGAWLGDAPCWSRIPAAGWPDLIGGCPARPAGRVARRCQPVTRVTPAGDVGTGVDLGCAVLRARARRRPDSGAKWYLSLAMCQRRRTTCGRFPITREGLAELLPRATPAAPTSFARANRAGATPLDRVSSRRTSAALAWPGVRRSVLRLRADGSRVHEVSAQAVHARGAGSGPGGNRGLPASVWVGGVLIVV